MLIVTQSVQVSEIVCAISPLSWVAAVDAALGYIPIIF